MTQPGTAAALPAVHVVTDDAVLARKDLRDLAVALLRSGGPRVALHLRGPRAPGRVLEALARFLRSPARDAGAWLIVNDRVDVAAVTGADGVQLGRRSLAPATARRIAPELAIGASVHSVEEARDAADADWLIFGTVYRSASHPDRSPAGPGGLAEVASEFAGPVLAIGGVTPARIPEVRASGASGSAVLGGVWSARHPLQALDAYISAWNPS